MGRTTFGQSSSKLELYAASRGQRKKNRLLLHGAVCTFPRKEKGTEKLLQQPVPHWDVIRKCLAPHSA